jgi:citrate/tricarballylate utilization protein
MLATENLREASRLMTICNACRYCEGLCAVFPAMEMRRTFADADLNYLANLCHGCGACYSDCQYSPPHEFAVNVPATLAKLRNDSYAAYAWPAGFAGAFANNGVVVTSLAALGMAAFIVGFVAWSDADALWSRNAGDFYKVMPHHAMVTVFGAAALYAIAAFALSLRAFWRDIAGDERAGLAAFGRATVDVAHLTYLHGGGGGCTSENDQPSPARRIFHHLTFYGFLFCFAATSVATVYHYVFGWRAPYAPWSLPVALGILGGIGLIAGPIGLFVLMRRRDPVLRDLPRRGLDVSFIIMLVATSVTGFALLVFRATAVMGLLLAVHLGVVLGLFLSMPYGKFVHGLYRLLALIKYASERRRGTFVE